MLRVHLEKNISDIVFSSTAYRDFRGGECKCQVNAAVVNLQWHVNLFLFFIIIILFTFFIVTMFIKQSVVGLKRHRIFPINDAQHLLRAFCQRNGALLS